MTRRILLTACMCTALVGCKAKGKDCECKQTGAVAMEAAQAKQKVCPPQRPCPRVAAKSTKKKAEPQKAKKGAKGENLAYLSQLAAALTRYGREHHHPGAIALAARVSQELKPVANPKLVPDAKSAKPGKKAKPGLPQDAAGLLAMAKKMAGTDKAQLATVNVMMKMGSKSRTSDHPGCVNYCIGGHSRVQYKPLKFYGGLLAVLVIRGDGDSDLDFYLYGPDGDLVWSDTDGTDFAGVRWIPPVSGRYTFVVRNVGSVTNCYRYCTN